MLLRYAFPVPIFIGALALTGWAFPILKSHTVRPDEMATPYPGAFADMRHLTSERQDPAGYRIAGDAVPTGSGGEARQAPSRGDSNAPSPPGYFERARMLLYLLRTRHRRK